MAHAQFAPTSWELHKLVERFRDIANYLLRLKKYQQVDRPRLWLDSVTYIVISGNLNLESQKLKLLD